MSTQSDGTVGTKSDGILAAGWVAAGLQVVAVTPPMSVGSSAA